MQLTLFAKDSRWQDEVKQLNGLLKPFFMSGMEPFLQPGQATSLAWRLAAAS